MFRLRLLLCGAFLVGAVSGCGGEDQPNAPAQPNETNADFAKKTADMMKAANSGMDLKKAQQNRTAPPAK
jgi:hypothetical protein